MEQQAETVELVALLDSDRKRALEQRPGGVEVI